MSGSRVRVFDGLATGHHRRNRRPAPRLSPHLRQQLVDDGPDPAVSDAASWWACPCGSWHHVTDGSCPDE